MIGKLLHGCYGNFPIVATDLTLLIWLAILPIFLASGFGRVTAIKRWKATA